MPNRRTWFCPEFPGLPGPYFPGSADHVNRTPGTGVRFSEGKINKNPLKVTLRDHSKLIIFRCQVIFDLFNPSPTFLKQ